MIIGTDKDWAAFKCLFQTILNRELQWIGIQYLNKYNDKKQDVFVKH